MKTAKIDMRLSPELKEVLIVLAREEKLKLSAYCVNVLEERVKSETEFVESKTVKAECVQIGSCYK